MSSAPRCLASGPPASCIIEAAGDRAGASQRRGIGEIIERAKTISALADAIQKQNYRILERIRPVILRQMGLPEALRQLVAAWQAQQRDCACAIEISGAGANGQAYIFDEEVSLTAYRIVQECLTNVARHAKASAVRVGMDVFASPAGGAEIRLAIEDDGVGLPADFRHGFGFLGISERVRKLDGRLAIGKGAQGGSLIEAFIPVRPPLRPQDSLSLGERLAGDKSEGEAAQEPALHG